MRLVRFIVFMAVLVSLFVFPPMFGVLAIGALGYLIGSKIKETKNRYDQTVNDYKAFKAWQNQQRTNNN